MASIPTRIIRRSRVLTLAQKYVWERIRELSRREERCTLSARALAVDLGLEERTVRHCRAKLQHYGLLVRRGVAGKPATWEAVIESKFVPAEHRLAQTIFNDCQQRLDVELGKVAGERRSRAVRPEKGQNAKSRKPRYTGPTLLGTQDLPLGTQALEPRSSVPTE